MREYKLDQAYWGLLLRCSLFLGSAVLIAWQVFTLLDVIQMHTAKAQNVSRSAGWANQPVGTMQQVTDDEEPAERQTITMHTPPRMLLTALP